MSTNLPAVYSMSDLEKMAQSIVKSQLFGVKSVEQAVTLMLVAQAEGLHPATAARDYHVIQGRPALKADAMLARFQNAGGRVDWDEYTDTRVCGSFSHPQSPKPVKIEWTMDMARKIGLANKDNWKNYPRAMLRARVISEGVRTCYPAIASGIYTPEEVSDFSEKDITPTAGAMQSLPVATQEIVIETATEMKALLLNDQAADAYALWKNSKFDADEEVALWSQFDSKQRGILKRMDEAERAQNAGVISPAKKKRLEALIKEHKLDREGLKNWCMLTFNKGHFTELSNDEYMKLDEHIASVIPKAAPQSSPSVAPADSESDSAAGTAGAALISAEQIREILALCEMSGVNISRVLLKAKLTKLEDMQAGDFNGAIKWIGAQSKVKT